MSTNGAQGQEWTPVQRGLFRLLFVYLVLYFFPLPYPEGLLYPAGVASLFDKPWQILVTWVGAHILHLHTTVIEDQGISDGLYDYVRLLCIAVLSVAIATIWSLMDRRRNYRALHAWTRVWLRYVLGIVLLDYGLIKVIKLQFPDPGMGLLATPFGELTPNHLLWSFMGFSKGYTFFAGAGEVVAAFLLFFRRTTTLGALIAVAVLSNVAMLNFSYATFVKVLSLHLLLISFFLIAPDFRRLANLFLLDRPTMPAAAVPISFTPGQWWTGVGLKTLVIGITLVSLLTEDWRQYKALPQEPTPPHGLYTVASFREGGKEKWDGRRWKSFGLGMRGWVWTTSLDDSMRFYKVVGDPLSGPFTLLPANDDRYVLPGTLPEGPLQFRPSIRGEATVEGRFDGKLVNVALRLETVSQFPLMSAGFHWIAPAQ